MMYILFICNFREYSTAVYIRAVYLSVSGAGRLISYHGNYKQGKASQDVKPYILPAG